jgi:hypothetical protein
MPVVMNSTLTNALINRQQVMKSLITLVLSLALCVLVPSKVAAGSSRPARPNKIDFYIVAHPDDWQLFMGDHAYNDIRNNHRVVFIYSSAGDANLGTDYWHVRESAANASAQFIVDLASPAIVSSHTSTCANQEIAGHPLQRCVYANTISYFMRLPDGNLDGAGYESHHFESLKKLREGSIKSISAIDGSTTYTGWGDFYQTIQQVIKTESNNKVSPNVHLNTQEHDPALTPVDHSDHLTIGLAVTEVIKGTQLQASYYVGYDIKKRPANLSSAASMYKSGTFMVYERVMQSKALKTTFCELPVSYSSWLFRTYFRTVGGKEQPPPPRVSSTR